MQLLKAPKTFERNRSMALDDECLVSKSLQSVMRLLKASQMLASDASIAALGESNHSSSVEITARAIR